MLILYFLVILFRSFWFVRMHNKKNTSDIHRWHSRKTRITCFIFAKSNNKFKNLFTDIIRLSNDNQMTRLTSNKHFNQNKH